jgi:Yip1 domain
MDKTRLTDPLAFYRSSALPARQHLQLRRFMVFMRPRDHFQRGRSVSIVDRAKNIIMKPADEWNVIAGEPASVGGLFTGYAMILAAIPLVAGILFTGVLGLSAASFGGMGGGAMAMGVTAVAGMAVIGYVLSLVTLYLMSLIVNAVSPSFNGKSDMTQSAKLMTYASTPTWVAGLVSWIPILGGLLSLAAIAYVVYLIYLGLKPVLGVPQEKVAGFTVVIVLIYIVLSLVVSGIIVGLLFTTFFGSAMMTGAMAGA